MTALKKKLSSISWNTAMHVKGRECGQVLNPRPVLPAKEEVKSSGLRVFFKSAQPARPAAVKGRSSQTLARTAVAAERSGCNGKSM